jgi:hypothetical protein
MEEIEKEKEKKKRIYILYTIILYIYFSKFRKKIYKKIGETVPSCAYPCLAISSMSSAV